jgi:acetylornithine deacetylase/succinyl-diaminopimelate desuccinylase-like protein
VKCKVLFFLALALQAQDIRKWREAHEQAILDEFFQLLAIPNIASDQVNIRRNADAIVAMMKKRGIEARLVEAPDVNPVVFGEIRTPGATRTVVFYAHYDGQPLDPKEWATAPFTPVIKDGRIYARSASDDKAPIIAMMAALDSGVKPKSNIKFVFEGEEEAGSANLGHILAANKELFSGDVWLICDVRCINRGSP